MVLDVGAVAALAFALALAFGAADSATAPDPRASTEPMADWRSTAEMGFKPVVCMTAAADVGDAALATEGALAVEADEAAGAVVAFTAAPPTREAALPAWGGAESCNVEVPELGFFFSVVAAPTDSWPAFVAGFTAGFDGSAEAFATRLWDVGWAAAGAAEGAATEGAAGALASEVAVAAGFVDAATAGAGAEALLP